MAGHASNCADCYSPMADMTLMYDYDKIGKKRGYKILFINRYLKIPSHCANHIAYSKNPNSSSLALIPRPNSPISDNIIVEWHSSILSDVGNQVFL